MSNVKSLIEFDNYDVKIVSKEDHYGVEVSYSYDGQYVGIGGIFENKKDAQSARNIIFLLLRNLDPNMIQRIIDRDKAILSERL